MDTLMKAVETELESKPSSEMGDDPEDTDPAKDGPTAADDGAEGDDAKERSDEGEEDNVEGEEEDNAEGEEEEDNAEGEGDAAADTSSPPDLPKSQLEETEEQLEDGDDEKSEDLAEGEEEEEEEEEQKEEKETTIIKSSTTKEMVTKRKKKPKKKKARQRRQHKIFQDAISVFIPLNVTADLKMAIQRTRAKRIKSIHKRFPSLKKEAKKPQEDDKDDPMLEDDDDENNKDKDSKIQQKKKKILENVPQPNQYGSVLDYLEAKYVKGVMLGDEDEEGGSMDDKSEGQGSVYSGASFLDDTDLQRDVAEQVMANTTMTKLELEEDDADFFVNVGNLEIEENEYGDHYDPLQDKEKQTTKKRKKSQSAASSTTPPKKKKPKGQEAPDSPKPAPSVTSVKKKKPTAKSENSEEKKLLIKFAKKSKSQIDAVYKKVAGMIKGMNDEELPRRRTKLKVALTCPPNKKPGDDITFTNPHNPGQRLRVKVPKDCFPGGTFKVTVPVKQPPPDADKDGADHNKFSRTFQELLDDYARGYDDWCMAQSVVDKKFALYKEKQQKFDRLIKEFPPSLVTPVDQNYLKKIVRRARQNRHKRIKTAAAKKELEDDTPTKIKDEPMSDQESKDDQEDEEEDEKPEGRVVDIPTTGSDFPSLKWDDEDFEMDNLGATGESQASKKQMETKPKKIVSQKSRPSPPKGRRVDIPTLGTKFLTKKWLAEDFS